MNNQIIGTIDGETLTGTIFADDIFGEGGDDLIYGGKGDDLIYGSWGKDVIYGGKGNDMIDAGDDADTIYAGKGKDKIYDGYDADYANGGKGADTFFFANDNATDIFVGGKGKDMIDISSTQNDMAGMDGLSVSAAADGFMELHWTDVYGNAQTDLIKGIEQLRDSHGVMHNVSDLMVI